MAKQRNPTYQIVFRPFRLGIRYEVRIYPHNLINLPEEIRAEIPGVHLSRHRLLRRAVQAADRADKLLQRVFRIYTYHFALVLDHERGQIFWPWDSWGADDDV